MTGNNAWRDLFDEIYLAQLAHFHDPSRALRRPGHSKSRIDCAACRTAAKVAADTAGGLFGVFPDEEN